MMSWLGRQSSHGVTFAVTPSSPSKVTYRHTSRRHDNGLFSASFIKGALGPLDHLGLPQRKKAAELRPDRGV
jgi:hypothetical protein